MQRKMYKKSLEESFLLIISQRQKMLHSKAVKRGMAARKRMLEGLPTKCSCGSRISYEMKWQLKDKKFCLIIYSFCIKSEKENCRLKKLSYIHKKLKTKAFLITAPCYHAIEKAISGGICQK